MALRRFNFQSHTKTNIEKKTNKPTKQNRNEKNKKVPNKQIKQHKENKKRSRIGLSYEQFIIKKFAALYSYVTWIDECM